LRLYFQAAALALQLQPLLVCIIAFLHSGVTAAISLRTQRWYDAEQLALTESS